MAQVQGLVGDPAGFPGGQVTAGDAFPEPGEAVAQLEGVAEVAFAGLGGQADGGGELGDGELRDQGGAGSGDGDGGVAEGAEPDGLGLVDGLGGVGDRPLHGGRQQVGLGLVGLGPPGPGGGEDACRVVGQRGGLRVVPRGGHGSIPAATTDTPDPEMGSNPLVPQGFAETLVLDPRVAAGGDLAGFRDGPAALLNQRWAGCWWSLVEEGRVLSETRVGAAGAGFRDGPGGPPQPPSGVRDGPGSPPQPTSGASRRA